MAFQRNGGDSRRGLTRVGQMVFSGTILGADPVTGASPEDLDLEVANCFANLRHTLSEAGCSLGDVGQVRLFVRDAAVRQRIGAQWLECFPDVHAQPARETILLEKLDYAIRMEVVAVVRQ